MNSLRKIIHVDMDCFYAAIEIRENPQLQGKAVAVGGSPERRGVLTTCNYEARKFGLHSAMSSAQAMKRCPNLILLPVNMPLYRQVSQQIHQIFRRYTDIIEPISLDEAYLDVTHCKQHSGSATWIAQAIRQSIYEELKLTASAGVAPLKFLAKIASDQNKPNGQFIIAPEQVDQFILNLPLKKIPGVGRVTNEKLSHLGLKTCADIQKSNLSFLVFHFGKFGQRLWDLSHGMDPRPVEANRIRKSLAVENTLLQDIDSLAEAEKIIHNLFHKLIYRIQRNYEDKPLHQFKKLGVKLKFDDFTQTTLEQSTDGLTLAWFNQLLHKIWQRRNGRKVRLIGLSIHLPEEKTVQQLNLWE